MAAAEFSRSRLRALRALVGFTRATLSQATGIAKHTISAYEQGRSAPSAAALGRLADALGVPIDALFDHPAPLPT